MIAFGPVPSRRFGQSLGVNNIPPKHCTYDCTYCQVGRTTSLDVVRRTFYAPEEVVGAVRTRLEECRALGQPVDVVTFVPDGEPTLDLHLGEEIRELKRLGVPVAVLTSGSLLWRADVRGALADADIVSVKVDTADARTWRRLNGPARSLQWAAVLTGLRDFASSYRGRLLTETMLVRNVNDHPAAMEAVAKLLQPLAPAVAYLAIPTRPPAHSNVAAPDEASVVAAYQTLAARLVRVELLLGEAPVPLGRTGAPVADLLGIVAVHPLSESAARNYLESNGAPASTLDTLLASGLLVRVPHRGRVFVVGRNVAPGR